MTTPPANRPPSAGKPPAAPAGGSASSGVVLDPVRILKQYKVPLAIAGVVGVVAGLVAFFALRQVNPVWTARINYQISPPIGQVTEETRDAQREEMDRYMNTQAAVLVEDRILKAALRDSVRLRNDTKWAQDFMSGGQINVSEALRELKKMVSARVRTGTTLVQMTVQASSPDDAAIIANAIDEAYLNDLTTLAIAEIRERREPMEQARTQLRNQINNLNLTITRETQAARLDDTGVGGMNPAMIEVQNIQQRLTELRGQLELANQRKANLEAALASEGGAMSFTDEQREAAERDPQVANQRARVAELRTQEASARDRGLADEHPERRRLRTLRDNAESELERTRQETLNKLLNADIESARRTASVLQNEQRDLQRALETAQQRLTAVRIATETIGNAKTQRDQVEEELRRIDTSLANIALREGLRQSGRVDRVRRLELAARPDVLTFPTLQAMVPAGILICLGLTAGIVVLRELLDQRVRGPSDVGYIQRLRLLGIIPIASEDPTRPAAVETAFRDTPTGAVSEAFRQVRGPLVKRMQSQGYKTLLVIAGEPGSGATTTVSNLAMGAAASDLKVLVIDANLRRPGLHKVFKLAEGPGLGDVLARKVNLDSAIQNTATPNLDLLSAGSAATRGVPERLSTETMTQTLADSRAKYDLIIIDSAPALVAGDGIALANKVDASLLVIKAYGEKRGLVARLRDQLSDARGEFYGVIVNAVRSAAGGYLRKNIRTAYEYQSPGQAA